MSASRHLSSVVLRFCRRPGRRRRRRGGAARVAASSTVEDVTARHSDVAALTLGHVLTSLGAEHDPPIGLPDIRVIRHSAQQA